MLHAKSLKLYKNVGQTHRFVSGLSIDAMTEKPPSNADVVIVGGGHNGLVSAAYLAKSGKRVVVVEKRHVLGGAAVTEEIVPGFKFSRASYLLSLFRPQVMQDLELQRHGLRWHMKNPASFTPMRNSSRSLLMGSDMAATQASIAQFSEADAIAYPKYEESMARICDALEPLMDMAPPNFVNGGKLQNLKEIYKLYQLVAPLGMSGGMQLYDLMTAPISKVMNSWFESEPLRATLGTDGVIGFNSGPHNMGTGYVLLHHVLGGVDGHRGVWAFAMGGMGAVSKACAKAALEAKAELFTNAEVSEINVGPDNKVKGVTLATGHTIDAPIVLSNCTSRVTYEHLLPQSALPSSFLTSIRGIDYTSPVTKINVAVNKLPDFLCSRNNPDGTPSPHHQTTVHLNCEDMSVVEDAFVDSMKGEWSKKPIIEMTIPTSVDDSLAPKGSHVVMLFTQYTPFTLSNGRQWDDKAREDYAKLVFSQIDAYCDGFSESVVGYECLPPPVLEKEFGLTGGNIFHGSMSLDQLFMARPTAEYSRYDCPINGLYMCGSGTHPGGGVTGSPGRLAAMQVLKR